MRLFVIVGPTAVGKTALAVELSRRLGAEVVSADSRQIYRSMDIGTAKPSPAERAAAPHHLVDIIDPDQPFSLAVYQDLASAAIAGIAGRGRLPMLVGGTGQYLAALLEGWQVPRVPPQAELRAQLYAEAERAGPAALHARLAQVDPAAAAAISPANTRRVIRALEVVAVTGQPFSTQQTRQPPPYQLAGVWLQLPRPQLYARIDARVDAMIAAGLVDEVRALLARGYRWELPSLSSLGYIQLRPYLEGASTLADAVTRLKFDTHAFARRQESWFRRLPALTPLPADSPGLVAQCLRLIHA